MSIEYLTILVFGLFLLVLAMGLPVVFGLGGVAVIATYFLWGPQALHMMANRTFTGANSFVLLAIPMFIFMGCMLERSGMARDLYSMMYKWMGPIRGGLAIGTVIICAIFAAMVGISGAATVSMGLVALPSMLKHNYSKQIAIGCISAGGALGVLIPPSVLMIILGLYTNTSIGGLYAGGILPGFLLAFLFCVYIFFACLFNKDLGPALPLEERASWREKLVALKAVILPIALIFGILGSIFMGVATPSEAAALGALGSILCSVIYRQFDCQALRDSLRTTLRLSCMVMWIIFGASVFTASIYGHRRSGPNPPIAFASPGGSLGDDYRHANYLGDYGLFPRPDGDHHDHRPRLLSHRSIHGIQFGLVRRPFRRQHGNGIHHPALRVQPFLYAGDRPKRSRDD